MSIAMTALIEMMLMHSILTIIEEAANKNMTTSKKPNLKNKGRIPEWKDDVEPFKENAHFWNAIWISAGKPLNCELQNIMQNIM